MAWRRLTACECATVTADGLRHVRARRWRALSSAEQAAIWALVPDVCRHIDPRHRPDGYNIGVNVGEAAGQTIGRWQAEVLAESAGTPPILSRLHRTADFVQISSVPGLSVSYTCRRSLMKSHCLQSACGWYGTCVSSVARFSGI